jgi:hypothetical protein
MRGFVGRDQLSLGYNFANVKHTSSSMGCASVCDVITSPRPICVLVSSDVAFTQVYSLHFHPHQHHRLDAGTKRLLVHYINPREQTTYSRRANTKPHDKV